MAIPTLTVALFGTRLMGRAHSQAWATAPRFFDLPLRPVPGVVAGRDPAATAAFAERWGWQRATTDWHEAVTDPGVDLVDIATPNDVHREQAVAALEAGKHVACEKPLAGNLDDARAMATAAARSGARTYVWYSYRRVPAVALAHRLVAGGRLGRIYHVRAAYLQDWGGPEAPLVWRFRGDVAGTGAHGDLGAHIIDMARFITGDEIVEVTGAIEERFVDHRPLPDDPQRSAPSTVDDAVVFLARFGGGAVATFESTRLATGYRNSNRIEVHGEHGALRYDFARMNELGFFDATLPARLQGWTTIAVTNPDHPYVHAWWPDGHGLGYEHTFTNQAADIVGHLGGREPEVPLPDFADALVTQRVMEASLLSARERTPIRLSDVV
jgi:predicted dehydrogenase